MKNARYQKPGLPYRRRSSGSPSQLDESSVAATIYSRAARGTAGIMLRPRTPITCLASLVWLASVDLLSRWNIQSVATLTVLGILIISVIVYVWTPNLGRDTTLEPRIIGQYRLPIALGIWVVYAGVRWAIDPQYATGIQNASVQIIAILTIAITSAQSSISTAKKWMPRMLIAVDISAIVYLASIPFYGPGNARILDARAFATVALVGLCIAISLHAATGSKRYIAQMILIYAALIASLSRAALLVGVVLLVVEVLKHRGAKAIIWAVARIGILAAGAWWLLENFAPLANRFETNDNANLFGIEVGTSGRTKLWATMQESIPTSPIFGQGPGSSNALITEYYGAQISHPHSEYLRIIHDYGWIGMLLIGAGFLFIMLRSWAALRNSSSQDAAVHLASVMAVVTLAMMAATSNITVYIFAMIPLCTLMGFSMSHTGRHSYRSAHAPRLRKTRLPIARTGAA